MALAPIRKTMEEIRICAFFDALGTSNIMKSDEVKRRNALIELIRKLEKNTASYSPGVENLGLGVVFRPSAQITTFSDNVAISFPLKRMSIEGSISNKPHTFYIESSQFFEHLLIQCINAVWDGLKLGILFRGGITLGRLVHDDKIIAGEALVKAAELEKATKYPRFEIDTEIVDAVDSEGNKVVSDDIKESLECIDGRWFVKVLDLHIGYWRDHNYYRSLEGKVPEEIPPVLIRIKKTLDHEYEKVIACGRLSEIEKWKWFMNEFASSFQKGLWPRVEGAYEAVQYKS